jgi:hypothetical protein
VLHGQGGTKQRGVTVSQYTVRLARDANEIEEVIGELAAVGWEVVSMTENPDHYTILFVNKAVNTD